MKIRFKKNIVILLIVFVALVVFVAQKFSASKDIWIQKISFREANDFLNLLAPLPNTNGKKSGVKIYDENGWIVYRSYPSGHLDVFFKNASGHPTRIDISSGWRRNTYPMLIMSVADRLFVVGYDVVRNIPSGHGLSVIQPGFDLYEIKPNTQGEPRAIATRIDLNGGIDSLVYGRVQGSNITICAENKCAEIGFQGKLKYWRTEELRDYEFIEVAFGAQSTFAIVRKKWDDRINGKITEEHARFFLANLSADRVLIKPFSIDEIPFALSVNDNNPTWKKVNSPETLRDLFYYELARMPNGGLINFGENNLEGRIAWSQVYYLNALISLANGDLKFSDNEMENYARDRADAEIELISSMAQNDYPGYRVKRYSIDREPLLFALHLGRIAHLLKRADQAAIGSQTTRDALDKIKQEMFTLEHTVETAVDCLSPKVCKTLAYRQGYPFLVDGLNVPFNYVSGYVSGILSVTDDESISDFAADLMKYLQEEEKFQQYPESWRYWGGEGRDGYNYENGGSLNTPYWHGAVSIAHISYRSMDAMALLMLNDRNEAEPSGHAANGLHFKKLVSEGLLYPFVNQDLIRINQRAKLSPHIAKRYSRSAQAWELQSQAWALSDLAVEFKRNQPYVHDK